MPKLDWPRRLATLTAASSLAVWLACAATLAVSAPAEATPSATGARPTIVLVHGAFADGSSWDRVVPLLQARGLHVVSVQNPLTSLADDVAATRRVLDVQTGPVVLVGHSWGGVVISEVGTHERVKSLVEECRPLGSRGLTVSAAGALA